MNGRTSSKPNQSKATTNEQPITAASAAAAGTWRCGCVRRYNQSRSCDAMMRRGGGWGDFIERRLTNARGSISEQDGGHASHHQRRRTVRSDREQSQVFLLLRLTGGISDDIISVEDTRKWGLFVGRWKAPGCCWWTLPSKS